MRHDADAFFDAFRGIQDHVLAEAAADDLHPYRHAVVVVYRHDAGGQPNGVTATITAVSDEDGRVDMNAIKGLAWRKEGEIIINFTRGC